MPNYKHKKINTKNETNNKNKIDKNFETKFNFQFPLNKIQENVSNNEQIKHGDQIWDLL